jgi:hypothetical protein
MRKGGSLVLFRAFQAVPSWSHDIATADLPLVGLCALAEY